MDSDQCSLSVAVGAFCVVIELNIKRQDNDRKIGVLFVQMRDMMESLLQCVFVLSHYRVSLTYLQTSLD